LGTTKTFQSKVLNLVVLNQISSTKTTCPSESLTLSPTLIGLSKKINIHAKKFFIIS
jgi:hypothetical protein